MIGSYAWSGGREAMLRFGPAEGPVVVAALPLFEEANRTRAFVVTMLRALADLGIASAHPDLPGQGESLIATHDTSLAMLRAGHAAAVAHAAAGGRAAYALGVRSGALLDAASPCRGRWHLAPEEGPDLLRALTRIKQATAEARLGAAWWQDAGQPIEVAGNLVSADLLAEISTASMAPAGPTPSRTVRLDTDPRPADHKLPGQPLWRRAEPDNDPALAALLAQDIAAWVRACED